jgi:shikimate dehydrogenase
MKGYGLIGFPLGHSFSVPYFQKKFEQEGIKDSYYKAFPIDSISKFPELLSSHPELIGLNITIPYKESVLKYLDEIDETADRIGAVNTLHIKNGKLKGFNTDILGFKKSLVSLLENRNYRALVLGTGGAAKAVSFVLDELNIPYRLVSRTPDKQGLSYQELNQKILEEFHLIVNCSPLGMYPHTDSFPEIPYPYLGPGHILFDLIYNPLETEFLKKGRERGAKTLNGLEMLHLQAEASWTIWNENES